MKGAGKLRYRILRCANKVVGFRIINVIEVRYSHFI